MDSFIGSLRDTLLAFGTLELNGLLALLYTAWQHGAALAAAGALRRAALLDPARAALDPRGARPAFRATPLAAGDRTHRDPGRVSRARAHAGAAGGHDAVRRASGGRRPVQPGRARWRAAGGLALYALAALAYLAYGRYLNALDAAAWAEALGGQGEAAQALAQGRAFISTLATWGLWLILPLGYLSLLAQGVLVHPPLPATPEQVITAVRTRGQQR